MFEDEYVAAENGDGWVVVGQPDNFPARVVAECHQRRDAVRIAHRLCLPVRDIQQVLEDLVQLSKSADSMTIEGVRSRLEGLSTAAAAGLSRLPEPGGLSSGG